MTIKPEGINSKESILEAAEQLIAIHGYAGLSMRELSKHSGVAKSTLYHYFQDKREIYLNVLERDFRTLAEELDQAAQSAGGDVEDRLRAVISTYLTAVLERGVIALNALRRSGNFDAEMQEFFCERRDAFLQPFRTLLEEGVEEGLLREDLDIELAILSLLGMMNSFVGQRLLFGGDHGDPFILPPLERIVEHTLTLYLQGAAKK